MYLFPHICNVNIDVTLSHQHILHLTICMSSSSLVATLLLNRWSPVRNSSSRASEQFTVTNQRTSKPCAP